MRKSFSMLKKLLTILLFVLLLPLCMYPSAQAATIAANTMTALINDTPRSMVLTSFYQLLGYAPTFTLLNSSGFPLSAITIYIPFDATAGGIYSSDTDNAYGAAGVAYSDFTLATSYSSLASASEGDNYFGIAGGQTAWVLQVDSISEDGSVIEGQFSAAFESTIWGTGEPATVYDGIFCLDMKQLPAPSTSSSAASDPYASFYPDALPDVGEIITNFASSNYTENTPCPICNGTGYRRDCTLCNGLGYGTGADVLYNGAYVCASCLGKGKIICVTCGGDGWIAP